MPVSSTHGECITFEDRCVAAFLGLALGDAFGRPLEFLTGPAVRKTAVDLDRLMWTDDTHMSLYLAEAVLEQGPDRLDEDAFGGAVGRAFVRWLDDPLTPSTAPGNTCLAGARRFRGGRDWRTSGVRESDGCGAVMRIAPVAMGFAGEELTQAARISAQVTHAHDNALDAAEAGAWLLRRLLEGAALDEALVRQRIRPGPTGDALEAALTVGFDEARIPPGDGGWRSSSALGLAVAAALGARDFESAVERAARIDGDSDSVAAITGMLLGAAGHALPEAWLARLPERARIEAVARRLAARGETWVAVADLHGHLDAFDALLRGCDARLGGYRLALLGDYCDNGPAVPALLDRLVALRAERGERFAAILGNHDLACLRALDDEGWYDRWRAHYWNGAAAGTPAAYGARSGAELRRHMPVSHVDFLRSLPWFHDTGRWFYVHSGLLPGPIAPQAAALAARSLPLERFHLPAPLRDKALSRNADPAWDRVVVSAHTKAVPVPGFVGPNRLCLRGEVDETGILRALVLPHRRWIEVGPDGEVRYTD